MVTSFGPPTWFITLSANEINWPDMLIALIKAKKFSKNGKMPSQEDHEEEANNLSY